ncbi:hypothetical protein ACFL3F_03120 [Planctomycetota bacterium]
MEPKQKVKGSWGLRFFIVLLSIVLGFLLYWLLSFVERDIGAIRGPEWDKVRGEFVSQQIDDEKKEVQEEVQRLNRKIDMLEEQQRILGGSTSSLQTTMNQLLSIQQQYIEKEQDFPVESMQTLQESQAAFLENQKQDQQYTQEISTLIQQRQQKEDALSTISEKIRSFESNARDEHKRLGEKYRLRAAFLKLTFLVPVFLVVSFLFMKYRMASYRPLVWSAFVAAFIKIASVAHQYFPKQYFKYIAILVVITIVLRLLVYLIRMIVVPKKELLIRQYQQFYDRHLCPVCAKPIKTGPLRYAGSKKKPVVFAAHGAEAYEQQSYTCPSCGTNLYCKCSSCGKIRHSVLPYCEHCGTEKKE